REDRYATADALRAALDAARGIPAGESVRPSSVEKHRKLPSLRPKAAPARGFSAWKATWIAGGVAAAMAGGAGGWLSCRARPAPGARQETLVTAPPAAQATSLPSVNTVPAMARPATAEVPPASSSAVERPLGSAGARPKATAAPSSGKSVTRVNSAGF